MEELRTLIENLKEEAATRTQIHEEVVSEIQKKDQIISDYNDKAERCKQALEMMQRVETSPNVIFEVISDLVTDTITKRTFPLFVTRNFFLFVFLSNRTFF